MYRISGVEEAVVARKHCVLAHRNPEAGDKSKIKSVWPINEASNGARGIIVIHEMHGSCVKY
jgi:hypothetical protein